jgi:hypothetical protein
MRRLRRTEGRAGERGWHSVVAECVFGRADEFYKGEEAIRVADNLLLYQNNIGGWPKNINMAAVLTDKDKADLEAQKDKSQTIIDNGATHTQIRYLALVQKATGEKRFADAARRGLEYLLVSQYANGGWPMIWPLRQGYYTHITFNDGDMMGVMRVLRDVAAGKPEYDFVDAEMRDRAKKAVEKGLEVDAEMPDRGGRHADRVVRPAR